MALAYHVVALPPGIGPDAHAAASSAVAEAIDTSFDAIHAVLDPFNPDSEIVALNAFLAVDAESIDGADNADGTNGAATGEKQAPSPSFSLSPLMQRALALAGEAHALTLGAYDATAKPLYDAWRSALAADSLLSPARQKDVMNVVGWHLVEVDDGKIVRDRIPPGVQIDLLGLAKGLAIDLIADALLDVGFEAFMVEWGGDMVVAGGPPAAPPSSALGGRRAGPQTHTGVGWGWDVAVATPPPVSTLFAAWTAGEPLADLAGSAGTLATLKITPPPGVRYVSVVTSGDYTELFKFGHTHFVDPHSGALLKLGAGMPASVTIVTSAACALADALATAAVVIGARSGPDGIAAWLDLLPSRLESPGHLAYGLWWRPGPDCDTTWLSTLESSLLCARRGSDGSAAMPAPIRRLLRCLPRGMWELRLGPELEALTATSVITLPTAITFALEASAATSLPLGTELSQAHAAELALPAGVASILFTGTFSAVRCVAGRKEAPTGVTPLVATGLSVYAVGDHVLVVGFIDGAVPGDVAGGLPTLYANREVTLASHPVVKAFGKNAPIAVLDPGPDDPSLLLDALCAFPAALMVRKTMVDKRIDYDWFAVRFVELSLEPALVAVTLPGAVPAGAALTLNLLSMRQKQLLGTLRPSEEHQYEAKASAAFRRLQTATFREADVEYAAIRSSTAVVLCTATETAIRVSSGTSLVVCRVHGLLERSPWRPAAAAVFANGIVASVASTQAAPSAPTTPQPQPSSASIDPPPEVADLLAAFS
ncbi:thiamine biosynthesis lipoprotein [Thecamonas trahens ATCC 50062]|uniref:FAD:protein FMN transferase n=1 Tax=Thecamonas trahens ATCC 50062 TaxID=461836 RepID=A0A0L0D401_THETB|nr:thiamine biosynthesis lipoprotein [Thecamonas trahens ATCC 50062]KNC46821.1 thiamine biosynthesis lipoprotein [Thecamonas trahens ATCC 50062]|eukprot:XP_013760096.1 thiamine biosynthesis lipoprotein [Thecamonas trahens ATCC 50062]